MKAKIGLHYFGRIRNTWAIWVYEAVNETTGFASARKVTNCFSFEEAVKTTYQLNGWGEPKNIIKKY